MTNESQDKDSKPRFVIFHWSLVIGHLSLLSLRSSDSAVNVLGGYAAV